MNTENLIKAIQETFPETLNGAVIFHLDKETKNLKSITPICPVESVQELYIQLSNCRDAIHHFLNDLVNKGLAKN
jgi:hypothetical protein